VLRSNEHALLLGQAVVGAFTTDKPCRRKANRPPGDAALAQAARLHGHDESGAGRQSDRSGD